MLEIISIEHSLKSQIIYNKDNLSSNLILNDIFLEKEELYLEISKDVNGDKKKYIDFFFKNQSEIKSFDTLIFETIKINYSISKNEIQFFTFNLNPNLKIKTITQLKNPLKTSLKKKLTSKINIMHTIILKEPLRTKTDKDTFKNLACIDEGYLYDTYLKNNKLCDNELFMFKYNIYKLIFIYNNLDLNGNYIHKIINFCHNETIEYIYLLSFMFERVDIYYDYWVVGYNFNKNLDIKLLEKCLTTSFYIENKESLKTLETYLINITKIKNEIIKFALENDLESCTHSTYNIYISLIYNLIKKCSNKELSLKYKYELGNLKYFFLTNYKKSFDYKENKLVRINSAINKVESSFLRKIIKDNKFYLCLEIGMAFGASSLSILLELSQIENKDKLLISIDPFQKTQWNNMGLNLISETGFSDFHLLIEEKSYIALPKLLETYTNKFHFIFIDGWHTFDYTLVDFFYSDKLLNIGGIIIIDDAKHSGVNKCVQYIKTNLYQSYRKLNSPDTVACFKKINEDTKNWNFHKNF
jgi:predicted O-methyltransferase YrrM